MKKSFFSYDPKNLVSDLTAGTTSALVTIPDGLASAILAGVNPVHGLYGLMVGTPIAALTLSSQFMYVANTGAIAVAAGDALDDYLGTQEQVIALGYFDHHGGHLSAGIGLAQIGLDHSLCIQRGPGWIYDWYRSPDYFGPGT